MQCPHKKPRYRVGEQGTKVLVWEDASAQKLDDLDKRTICSMNVSEKDPGQVFSSD